MIHTQLKLVLLLAVIEISFNAQSQTASNTIRPDLFMKTYFINNKEVSQHPIQNAKNDTGRICYFEGNLWLFYQTTAHKEMLLTRGLTVGADYFIIYDSLNPGNCAVNFDQPFIPSDAQTVNVTGKIKRFNKKEKLIVFAYKVKTKGGIQKFTHKQRVTSVPEKGFRKKQYPVKCLFDRVDCAIIDINKPVIIHQP